MFANHPRSCQIYINNALISAELCEFTVFHSGVVEVSVRRVASLCNWFPTRRDHYKRRKLITRRRGIIPQNGYTRVYDVKTAVLISRTNRTGWKVEHIANNRHNLPT
jgi:hypothetical protein